MKDEERINAPAALADEALKDVAGGQMPPQCADVADTQLFRKNTADGTAESNAANQDRAPGIMPWSVP